MSFILNDTKKNALAIVKGGEFKNKYLHIRNNNNFSISDIPNNLKENLDDNEKDILNNSIKEKLQPKEEKLENKYYELMNYLKEKKKKDFILRKGGKFEVMPIKKNNLTEKLYICGVSGAGKSTYAGSFIKKYLKENPENEFFLISNVNQDEILDKLYPIRIDINIEEPLEMEDLKNSVVLFDDIDTIQNKNIRNYFYNLLDDLIQTGRHYNITIIFTSHIIMNYKKTRNILLENTSMTMFINSGNNLQNIKYLKNYCNFNNSQINKILNLNSRWVSIYKSNPEYVIYEKGIYLI